MNLLLLFVEILTVFGLVVFFERFFGKEGLIAWLPVASILANIMTCKQIDMLGVSTTLGTVLFASTFLATDILSEKYSKKEALKAVKIGMLSVVTFILSTQVALLYIPNGFDYANEAMQTLFSLSLRISIASVVMYFVANLCDVYLYDKLKQKTNGKHMWLRNNVSTILCNCLENFLFMLLAFLGTYDLTTVLIMALSASVVEVVAGVCDTPFLYLATMNKKEK